ncbi:hypothetical protein KJ966_30765 [bacterium]|nr:hypothetical protein [bacterium]
MTTAILDQNGILNLNDQLDIDEFITTPMFFWELFNNIESSREQTLIQFLRQIVDKITVTNKSITCEKLEIESKSHKDLSDFINLENTAFIRESLKKSENPITNIRDKLAFEFTKDNFKERYSDLAEEGWIPKLKSQFGKFKNANDRQKFREGFEKIDQTVTFEMFKETLSVCFGLLEKHDFSHEEIVLFIKQPTVIYNRAFCHVAIFEYRSTQTSYKKNALPNDSKDIDYLFCAHLVDQVFGGDQLMNNIFSHLKKSYQILADTETGLD